NRRRTSLRQRKPGRRPKRQPRNHRSGGARRKASRSGRNRRHSSRATIMTNPLQLSLLSKVLPPLSQQARPSFSHPISTNQSRAERTFGVTRDFSRLIGRSRRLPAENSPAPCGRFGAKNRSIYSPE